MIIIVLTLAFVVLVLAVLVAGLLRSHADILKALHDLGAGLGDPAGDTRIQGHGSNTPAGPVSVPLTLGPALPAERNSTSAPAITGTTPGGDALSIAVAGSGTLTLVAFLSSGCATCAGFWRDVKNATALGLSEEVRVIVVTKGPDMEIPSEVAARAAGGLTVIMSSAAWDEYEVPGSPFFALVDGVEGRRIGEGVAHSFTQVVELVGRAQADIRTFSVPATSAETRQTRIDTGPGPWTALDTDTGPHPGPHPHPGPGPGPGSGPHPSPGPGSVSDATGRGLSGPERESDNDRVLIAAGIHPGHRSLYPKSLDDVIGPPNPEGPVAQPFEEG